MHGRLSLGMGSWSFTNREFCIIRGARRAQKKKFALSSQKSIFAKFSIIKKERKIKVQLPTYNAMMIPIIE